MGYGIDNHNDNNNDNHNDNSNHSDSGSNSDNNDSNNLRTSNIMFKTLKNQNEVETTQKFVLAELPRSLIAEWDQIWVTINCN